MPQEPYECVTTVNRLYDRDEWVDSDEADPARGVEQAHAMSFAAARAAFSCLARTPDMLPYQHEIEIHHTDNVADQFQSSEYEHARITYNSSIDTNSRIKLRIVECCGAAGTGISGSVGSGCHHALGSVRNSAGDSYGSIEQTDDGVTFAAADEEPGESLRDLDS